MRNKFAWIGAVVLMLSLLVPGEAASKKKTPHAKPVAQPTPVASPVEAKKTTTSATVEAWLKKMKEKISRSQKNHNQLIAVAAVRGAEAETETPLYWKGAASSPEKISEAELKEFDAALNLAVTGDTTKAKESFEKFISQNPNSPLVADAKETLTHLTSPAE